MQQQTRRPTVTLLLGGARSGKSRYAQQLASEADAGASAVKPVVFIATASAVDRSSGAIDADMRRKIEHHRADRPAHWLTIEEPLALAGAIALHADKASLLLIDCLTFYAFNLLVEAGSNQAQLDANLANLSRALTLRACPIVLVSNEVGSGIVPGDAFSCSYRDLLGEINQRIASLADDVLYLVAGLPLPLKLNGQPVFAGARP